MARNYWFTSDTHFFHHNIIDYCKRPFQSVEEMNETLVENWNRLVKPGDIVYHLGDVVMGPSTHEDFSKLWARLVGSKRLIVGNHDNIRYLSSGSFFKKVMLWRVWNDLPFVFTHLPLHESSIVERTVNNNSLNIHGHTHNTGSPTKNKHYSVCVELHNYSPVNLDQIKEYYEKEIKVV